MKKNEFQQFGPAVDQLFKNLGFEKKMKEVAAKKGWEEVVGKVFAQETKKMNLFNNTLFVYVHSPAVRYELINRRSLIAKKINEIIGENLIHEIVIK